MNTFLCLSPFQPLSPSSLPFPSPLSSYTASVRISLPLFICLFSLSLLPFLFFHLLTHSLSPFIPPTTSRFSLLFFPSLPISSLFAFLFLCLCICMACYVSSLPFSYSSLPPCLPRSPSPRGTERKKESASETSGNAPSLV